MNHATYGAAVPRAAPPSGASRRPGSALRVDLHPREVAAFLPAHLRQTESHVDQEATA
jgi:hypothetical protein